MSRLTRDGTAEPICRGQILRRVRGQGNINFPCLADHEQGWQPYPVDQYYAMCDDNTGGGGGGALPDFFFFFFPCSADHERDWPPCKVVFFGLATNALNVRNNNNNIHILLEQSSSPHGSPRR